MNKVLDLMKRMGEDISPLSFWDKLIDENPIVLKEGLITSYDGEIVLNAICDSFHLRRNGKTPKISAEPLRGSDYVYIGDAFLSKENEEEIIKIKLEAKEDFIDVIKKRLEKYGWSLFRKDKDENNKTIFNFEKRYPTSFYARNILNITDKIYHIGPSTIVNKVKKQGLIPKESKSPGFYNEPRIYLSFENNYNWDMVAAIRGVDTMVTFEIDVNKLNPEHKFFWDGRMPSAFFTLEPIPPKAINIIK